MFEILFINNIYDFVILKHLFMTFFYDSISVLFGIGGLILNYNNFFFIFMSLSIWLNYHNIDVIIGKK